MQRELAAEMEHASDALEFERAAAVRDRIRGLTHVQSSGIAHLDSVADADVIAASGRTPGQTCVQVFFVRGGRNNGNRAFFPAHAKGEEAPEVLAAFVAQFYDDKPPPPLVLLSHEVPEIALVAEALGLRAASFGAGKRVEVAVPKRGEKHDVVEHARTNAREATRAPARRDGRPSEATGCDGRAVLRSSVHRSGSRSTTTATSWGRMPMA